MYDLYCNINSICFSWKKNGTLSEISTLSLKWWAINVIYKYRYFGIWNNLMLFSRTFCTDKLALGLERINLQTAFNWKTSRIQNANRMLCLFRIKIPCSMPHDFWLCRYYFKKIRTSRFIFPLSKFKLSIFFILSFDCNFLNNFFYYKYNVLRNLTF